MSSIEITPKGITELDTQAVVNAANEHLMMGSGVCGYIFNAAGPHILQAACDQIGHCGTGKAVITPAFNMRNAKYIIHAVGPIYKGGFYGEPKLLYGAYYRSLELCLEKGITSVGFPLISAGVFGYPVYKAWKQALKACRDFIKKHPDFDIRIVFAIPGEENRAYGDMVMKELKLC